MYFQRSYNPYYATYFLRLKLVVLASIIALLILASKLSSLLSILIVMLQRATCKESAAKLLSKLQNLLVLFIWLRRKFSLYLHFDIDCFRERPVKRSAAKQISKCNVIFWLILTFTPISNSLSSKIKTYLIRFYDVDSTSEKGRHTTS